MARGTQHRKRRPRPDARAVAATAPAPKRAKPKVKHASWEDQLFFSRLRLHTKWVFGFLAVVFAGTFIFLGVGSGSTGIGDALQNFFTRSSGGSSSLSSLQNKVKKDPKSAAAWRSLATRLEQDQKSDRAISALQHYTKLAPKDDGALEELANLYVQRAADYYNLYSQLLAQSQLVSDTSDFRPAPSSPLGKAFAGQDPILVQQAKIVQNQESAALQRLGILDGQSEATYKRLVKVAPQNASYQLQLGQVAANLGDKPTAEKAYKAFLKLAPNDPAAPKARAALKALAAKPASVSATAAKKSGGG